MDFLSFCGQMSDSQVEAEVDGDAWHRWWVSGSKNFCKLICTKNLAKKYCTTNPAVPGGGGGGQAGKGRWRLSGGCW